MNWSTQCQDNGLVMINDMVIHGHILLKAYILVYTEQHPGKMRIKRYTNL